MLIAMSMDDIEFRHLRGRYPHRCLADQLPMDEPARLGGQLGTNARVRAEKIDQLGMVFLERQIIDETWICLQPGLDERMLDQEGIEPG